MLVFIIMPFYGSLNRDVERLTPYAGVITRGFAHVTAILLSHLSLLAHAGALRAGIQITPALATFKPEISVFRLCWTVYRNRIEFTDLRENKEKKKKKRKRKGKYPDVTVLRIYRISNMTPQGTRDWYGTTRIGTERTELSSRNCRRGVG